MKLIWTYSSSLRKNYISDKVTEKLIIELYHKSIESAKRFHSTKVYTTEKDRHYFEGIVDELVLLPTDLDLYFMDDIKFYVLLNETNPYTLIDGDLILNEKLYLNNFTLGFEKIVPYENSYYSKYNKILESAGIEEIVPFWKPNQYCFNIGLITVNSNIDFIDFYKIYSKLKLWYKSEIEPKFSFMKAGVCIEMSICTYLLSQFVFSKGFNYDIYEKYISFNHYSGTNQKLNFSKKELI